jgi:hypothetical protein
VDRSLACEPACCDLAVWKVSVMEEFRGLFVIQ